MSDSVTQSYIMYLRVPCSCCPKYISTQFMLVIPSLYQLVEIY